MTRQNTWKYVLGAALLLAAAVIAYALYEAGRLPGVRTADPARAVGAGGEDLFWAPETASPQAIAELHKRAQLERELDRHKPWGIKPDEDDPRLTEEQRDEIKKQWKERRKVFQELPKEQRQAIKQRCRKESAMNPEFDCTTLWSPPG